jgi:hypothetical protein
MLQPIVELDRLTAVSPEPHAVAIDGETLYISSRATKRIDVIDRGSWKQIAELDTPGMPWGLAFGGGALVATCGETEEDHRRIRRYDPRQGWGERFVACPDDTGSHLAIYGDRIMLGQWYNKALLSLDAAGNVTRRYDAPHGIAGVAVHGDSAYLLTTDDEDAGEYWITRLDLTNGASADVAIVPFHARGLCWDGARFWTNFREADRVVTFNLPA